MPGVFNINVKENIIYKDLNINHPTGKNINKELKTDSNYELYKQYLNSHNLPIIGRFISSPISIERNGNYSMNFIDGINLMDLLEPNHKLCKFAGWNSKNIKLDKNTCVDILRKLNLLINDLHQYSKKNSLRGDWFLHNLIYEPLNKKIYNVDLEGFYTYYNDSPMCDLKVFIPRQFDACKKELLKQINSQLFSIILWNPVKKYYNEIEDIIKDKYNIILSKEHFIDDMKTFVDKVYELDVRCHKPYLPKKIEILEKYEKQVSFFLILIDNPEYDLQNVSQNAVRLKEEIRNKYKSKLENYYKDIIIHVSDNSIEAENIYKLTL